MADLFEDRIHPATARQRRQARSEGRSPRSRDLASALVMLTALLALLVMGGSISDQLAQVTRDQLQGPANGHVDADFSVEAVVRLWKTHLSTLGQVLFPLLGLMVLAAVVAHAGQIGLLFLPERALPRISHLNPASGLERIFSVDNAGRWLMGIARISVIVIIAGISLWSSRSELSEMISSGPIPMTSALLHFLLLTAIRICAGLVLLGCLDYAWQRWRWEQQMKMTSEQLREEQKLMEGPERKKKSLPVAGSHQTLLICSPHGLAVEISYDRGQASAPVIKLRAEGPAARQAEQLASEQGRPLVHDEMLARQLYRTSSNAGEPINPACYRQVARYWSS